MSSADSPDLAEPDNWDDIRSPALALNTATTNPPTLALFRDNTQGLIAKALDFNGTDAWASLASNAAYTTGVGGALTWAFWIQPDATQTANPVPLIEKTGKWELRLRQIGPNWVLRLYLGGLLAATSSVPVSMGARNLVLFQLVDTGGTSCQYKLKINNTLAFDVTSAVVDAAADIRIARGYTLASYYAGLFDELVVYSGAALDNATVSNGLWNSGNGTTTPTTDVGITVTSHWKCDEIVANAIADENAVVSLVLGDGAGNQAPDLVTGGLIATSSTRGVYTYMFAPGEIQEVLVAVQMPHGYKLGTNLKPHIHWTPTSTAGGNVVWGIELSKAGADQAFGATETMEATAAASTTPYDHQKSGLGTLTPPGSANDTSFMIIARIYRKGDDPADTYPGAAALIEFDIHYQSDKAGTVNEFGPT